MSNILKTKEFLLKSLREVKKSDVLILENIEQMKNFDAFFEEFYILYLKTEASNILDNNMSWSDILNKYVLDDLYNENLTEYVYFMYENLKKELILTEQYEKITHLRTYYTKLFLSKLNTVMIDERTKKTIKNFDMKKQENQNNLFDILVLKFNSKLKEMHFIGFSEVDVDSSVNEAIDFLNDFNNNIELLKKAVIKVVGNENLNPDATKITTGLERDEKTNEISYNFMMQVKKECIFNKAKDLSNYFYSLEYDNCLEKIQINKEIFYDKKTRNH